MLCSDKSWIPAFAGMTFAEIIASKTQPSEQDYRCPIGQGEEWFQALQILGVPSRFVRYHRESYEL